MDFKSGYSDVNGIKMYYEIYGTGETIVLIHGGGSTIQTSFGIIIPKLAENYQVIGVEMQAHGRTSDRDAELSFEQDADDVATLLKNLNINRAHFLGFSNGGTTAIQIGIRHPNIVNKLILASAMYSRNGVPEQFWEFMKNGSLKDMPQAYKDAYTSVSPKPENLQLMFNRCAYRMIHFKDIPEDLITKIVAPTLIINGDKDVMFPEHGIALNSLIKNSQLAIIPGGHGAYMGEITTLEENNTDGDFQIPLILKFLGK